MRGTSRPSPLPRHTRERSAKVSRFSISFASSSAWSISARERICSSDSPWRGASPPSAVTSKGSVAPKRPCESSVQRNRNLRTGLAKTGEAGAADETDSAPGSVEASSLSGPGVDKTSAVPPPGTGARAQRRLRLAVRRPRENRTRSSRGGAPSGKVAGQMAQPSCARPVARAQRALKFDPASGAEQPHRGGRRKKDLALRAENRERPGFCRPVARVARECEQRSDLVSR